MSDLVAKLLFVRLLAWGEVFEIWRQNEEGSEGWRRHWQSRGFESWEEWRSTYVEPLALAARQWALYQIPNPLEMVPQFHGGPFRSWVEKFYDGRQAPTFAELARHTGVQNHEYVLRLMEHFPAETIVSGIALPRGVVIIEGMHRACALALANLRGRAISTKLSIALVRGEEDTLPLAGQGGP